MVVMIHHPYIYGPPPWMRFSEDTFKMDVYINCYAEKTGREGAKLQRLIYFPQNKKQSPFRKVA